MRRAGRWLGKVTGALLATGCLAATTAAGAGPIPAESESGLGSTVTTSHYMVLPDDPAGGEQVGHRTGCVDGRDGVHGLRVLFFGTQEPGGRIRPPGTTAGSPATRVDEAVVERAAAGWVRGFTTCGPATAVVALGASNKADGGVAGARAGMAWARLVERVAAAAPTGRVTVAGSLDGEPGWGNAQWARDWVDGYVAVTGRKLYAAGSADGCPDRDGPGDGCLNGWSQGDVFHVSSGAGPAVYALPQIYRTDGIQARQWARISRWGVRNGHGPLRVAGALSQQAACRQKGCSRTDNSPDTARRQLAAALAEEPGTWIAVPLSATDVAWPEDEADAP